MEAAGPFRIGEELDYQVGWLSFLSAASAKLEVVERRDLYGWNAWHFRALVDTLRPLRSLFAIDDELDSYSDAASLASRQFEMDLHERGREHRSIQQLVPPHVQPLGDYPSVLVPPGTRDPLGELYALREVDWRKTPVVRGPLFDGRYLYEFCARLESLHERVQVVAGTYVASRIEIQLFDDGQEVPQTRLELWLANDAPHEPVRMNAELPFGNLRVELTSAELAGAAGFSFPGRPNPQAGN